LLGIKVSNISQNDWIVMEYMIGLALLWLVWLLSSRRWRLRLRIPLVAIAILLLLTSPWSLQIGLWGLTLGVPPDSQEPVDAIVVLGRGNDFRDSRVVLAQQLWNSKRAPQIFISGMLDARLMMQELTKVGIPAQHLSGEECSQSTEENALFTNAILRPQGIQKILLVTDAPHVLRSLLTFRSFGFHVIPHPSPLPPLLSNSEKLKILLREYAGLVQYLLTGQFQPRPLESVNHPAQAVTQKIVDWGCRDK
jgi:uncharacterized SAM-binding protein YcdF (DUF218 family)